MIAVDETIRDLDHSESGDDLLNELPSIFLLMVDGTDFDEHTKYRLGSVELPSI